MSFSFGNVEVLYTRCRNPFKFLQDVVMIPSELDILLVLAIHLVVIDPHVPWCSIQVGSHTPFLCMLFSQQYIFS